jgi:hypothetical protein
VHITGTFRFTALNGCQSYKQKNPVRLSQIKLLTGFPPKFTGVIRTIHSFGRHVFMTKTLLVVNTCLGLGIYYYLTVDGF